jgi:hypothetical protein
MVREIAIAVLRRGFARARTGRSPEEAAPTRDGDPRFDATRADMRSRSREVVDIVVIGGWGLIG